MIGKKGFDMADDILTERMFLHEFEKNHPRPRLKVSPSRFPDMAEMHARSEEARYQNEVKHWTEMRGNHLRLFRKEQTRRAEERKSPFQGVFGHTYPKDGEE
jgi:hypothetical protein